MLYSEALQPFISNPAYRELGYFLKDDKIMHRADDTDKEILDLKSVLWMGIVRTGKSKQPGIENFELQFQTAKFDLFLNTTNGHELVKRKIQKEEKAETYPCSVCGDPVYPSQNLIPHIYRDAEDTFYLCDNCVHTRFLEWCGKFSNPREAIYFFCYYCDEVYAPNAVESCINRGDQAATSLGRYIKKLNLRQYSGRGFIDYSQKWSDIMEHLIAGQPDTPGILTKMYFGQEITEAQNNLFLDNLSLLEKNFADSIIAYCRGIASAKKGHVRH